jgi:hypothetical protein
MPQANLTPILRPYDPSTVPSPTPQQAERLARAGNAVVSGYASDGVQNTRPALAAAVLAAGIAAPELLVPAGAALAESAGAALGETAAGAALEGTAAGALFGAVGRTVAGAAGGAARSAAGAFDSAAEFIGQAGRAFVDSSAAAARSLAGTLTDPARFGEAGAQFTRSAFVDKAKDVVVIGAAGELARRAGTAVHGLLERAHRHGHHRHAPPDAADRTAELVGGR